MNNRKDKAGFDFDVLDLPTLPPKPASAVASSEEGREEAVSLPESGTEQERIENTIESLFQKMKKKGDFPSFSKQIVDVNNILKLKYASAKDIANVIMKDFSLSNKLLKLVNSSFYGQFSKGGISSVSSAMIILGADQVQQAAASLMLFEHMQANSQNNELKDITIGTFLSGLIAKDIATKKQYEDTEEFLICSMFHNLGENLIVFYFPDKYRRVNQMIKKQEILKHAASKKVLGITYQELGVGIAKKWGLPKNIIHSMQGGPEPSDTKYQTRETSRRALLSTIASFSNELCDIQKQEDPALRASLTEKLLAEYETSVTMDSDEVNALMTRVAEKIRQHSTHLNINVKNSSILQHLGGGAAPDQKTAGTEKKQAAETASDKKAKAKKARAIKKTIMAEIDSINNQMKTKFSITDVLTRILEVMHREFEFTRVAICIKDVAGNHMKVRYGLGKDIDAFIRDFQFPLSGSQDIFHRTLSKEADFIVRNVNDPKYQAIIPDWYRKLELATGFDLYSIVVNHVPIGFFYADREDASDLSSPELQGSMKRLRSLAEKAILLKKANR